MKMYLKFFGNIFVEFWVVWTGVRWNTCGKL